MMASYSAVGRLAAYQGWCRYSLGPACLEEGLPRQCFDQFQGAHGFFCSEGVWFFAWQMPERV